LPRRRTDAKDASAALQQFGSPIAFTEQAQDVWLGRWLVDARQDLRYAARMLTRQRVFASIAIGTLAIGIAANTAMFSVVRAVMLQPLPYRDPSGLVVVWDRDARQTGAAKLFAQYRDLEHWRARSLTASVLSVSLGTRGRLNRPEPFTLEGFTLTGR
jgi:hypothetical protein